jgi:hypothetical protein
MSNPAGIQTLFPASLLSLLLTLTLFPPNTDTDLIVLSFLVLSLVLEHNINIPSH